MVIKKIDIVKLLKKILIILSVFYLGAVMGYNFFYWLDKRNWEFETKNGRGTMHQFYLQNNLSGSSPRKIVDLFISALTKQSVESTIKENSKENSFFEKENQEAEKTKTLSENQITFTQLQKMLDDISEEIDLLEAEMKKSFLAKNSQDEIVKEDQKEIKKEEVQEEKEEEPEKETKEKETIKEICSVNLNTGSFEDLKKIVGVGPVLAQRIIQARPFSSIYDLLKVQGIGQLTLEKIIAQNCAYVPSLVLAGNSNLQNTTSNNAPANQNFYPKILISEIQIEPIENRFIELYNPKNQDVNLSGWYLQRKTENATSFSSLVSSTYFEGKIIKAKNYFLIASSSEADIVLRPTLTENNSLALKNPNREIADLLGWGNGPDYETAPADQPESGKSLARKYSTTTENYLDTDNNKEDFEIQLPTPKSQNQSSSSLPSSLPTPPLSVVINEIAWMGTLSSANDEWIELHNPTKETIDLTGWKLISLTDNSPNIILSGQILPLGFYLLERTNDNTISDISADKIYTGSLNNSECEVLALYDKNDYLIDQTICQDNGNWPAGKASPNYVSMERINPRKTGKDILNWQDNKPQIKQNGLDASQKPISGTPKSENSVYQNLAPSAVENFLVDLQKSQNNNVFLTWSVATDTDNLPEEISYQIYYAKNEITKENLNSASSTITTSTTLEINNLDYNSLYYFGIVDFDGKDYSPLTTTSPYQIPSALANSPWPMFRLNYQRNSQSQYLGPVTEPGIAWIYNEEANQSQPDWNPSYGQLVIKPEETIFLPVSYPPTDTKKGILILNSNGSKKDFWQKDTSFYLSLQADGSVLNDEMIVKDSKGNFYSFSNNDKSLVVLDSQNQEKWQREFQIFCSTNTQEIIQKDNKILIFVKNNLCPAEDEWQNSFSLKEVALPPTENIYLLSDAKFNLSSPINYIFLFVFSPEGNLLSYSIIDNGYNPKYQAISQNGNSYFFYLNTELSSTTLNIIAISPQGKILWQKRNFTDYANFSPIVIDNQENIYFAAGKIIFAFDKNGHPLWQKDLSLFLPTNWHENSIIGIALNKNGDIFLSAKGAVIALR